MCNQTGTFTEIYENKMIKGIRFAILLSDMKNKFNTTCCMITFL